jgi:hypothetical protein
LPCTVVLDRILLEPISKIGFWFKIAAGPNFPAARDFPPNQILFVGRKPQAYCCMSRI